MKTFLFFYERISVALSNKGLLKILPKKRTPVKKKNNNNKKKTLWAFTNAPKWFFGYCH